MKAADVKVNGQYIARVSGNIVIVRVDQIRDVTKYRRNVITGQWAYHDGVVYDVTSLDTGRKTTFKSAAKLRREVAKKGGSA